MLDDARFQVLGRLTAGFMFIALIAGCQQDRARVALDPSVEPLARRVADRVLIDFPDPPPFDWGEGVLMAGMMQAGDTFNEPGYIAFVQKWADHWQAYGVRRILVGGPTPQIQRYCGHWGPGYPVILLYEKTRDPRYLAMVRQIADFILTEATRTRDGGLGHWGGNHQLWVDTLYMAAPPLAHLTKMTGDPSYLDEAVRQIHIYASHVQEPSGLFRHMYDEPAGRCVGTLWGRGNGWVAMSYVVALKHMRPDSPAYRPLLADFCRQMDGLLAAQDKESWMWHTVIDHPETYVETSATAMILSALVEADQLGLYPLKDNAVIARTWKALAAKVDADGHVFDVSGGTGPQELEDYATKSKDTYTWGTGAFLMAASGLHKGRVDCPWSSR